MDTSEFSEVEPILSQLPSLAISTPINPAFDKRSDREPLLSALANAPSSATLGRLCTISGKSSRPDKTVAAELKILDKGVGISGSRWLLNPL